MRVVILYHPKSEHWGRVADYAHDFQRFKDKPLELVSLETVEGAHLAELYDVTLYPAILAIANDGHLQKLWQDEQLPLMNELEYYTQSVDTTSPERDFARAEILSS